ncbi:alpha-L-fucosidase [Ruania halotolerans]|uniref:alpha-L-fucosidase n=1 Tax=Ruania halotolerans TaxID=2897773 RepID=UPI001E5A3692|nr:alpha-L-fucosidase [Ruania halotolerans]UFU06778.1 alpha-L-fucosidase [Ruania halotolerans]
MTASKLIAHSPSVPRPTDAQLAWQGLELGVFFHIGVNTFAGREWSDGTLPAESFAPTRLDAAQWVRTAAEAGARYVVLTAKHHDGFCLWPTATTDYSVASSPWRDGRGDLVAEVAAACREQGIGLGLYLSPWDRHAPEYPDPAAYDALYLAQLRELCTNYGELVELWFDGAGSAGRSYDWESIMALTAELQPGAMVFNMGTPTIRWIGNEDGLAGDPVRYAVDSASLDNYTDAVIDLGAARYVPPEADVSIRQGWFWAADDEPKSVDHLLAIYYRSVGMGANLLLNVPPDTRGLIDDADVTRLREWRAELDRRFASPVPGELSQIADGVWEVVFEAPVTFDHLDLAEYLNDGQRVSAHRAVAVGTSGDGAEGPVLAEGRTIGHRRIHAHPPVTTHRIRIELTGAGARLAGVQVHHAGTHEVPEIAYLAPTDEPE